MEKDPKEKLKIIPLKESLKKQNEHNIIYKDQTFKLDIDYQEDVVHVVYYREREVPDVMKAVMGGHAGREVIAGMHVQLKWWEKPFTTLDKKVEMAIEELKERFKKDITLIQKEENLKNKLGID